MLSFFQFVGGLVVAVFLVFVALNMSAPGERRTSELEMVSPGMYLFRD